MKRLKSFFSLVSRSASDPEYYNELVGRPFSFSLKYFYLLLLTLTAAQVLFFVLTLTTLIPQIPGFIQTIKKTTQNAYPQDLVLTINNGKLSANVPQPYHIDPPGTNDMTDGHYEHVITIDTTSNVETYPEQKSVFLLTENGIAYPEREGQGTYRVYTWSSLGRDLVIDKQAYDNVISKVLPWVDYISGFVIVFTILLALLGPFILAFFIMIGKMIFLVILAIVAFFIARYMKKQLDFGKVYQLSLHALTMPIIISFFQSFLPEPQGSGIVPWLYHNMYSVLFIVFMILVFRSLHGKKHI